MQFEFVLLPILRSDAKNIWKAIIAHYTIREEKGSRKLNCSLYEMFKKDIQHFMQCILMGGCMCWNLNLVIGTEKYQQTKDSKI